MYKREEEQDFFRPGCQLTEVATRWLTGYDVYSHIISRADHLLIRISKKHFNRNYRHYTRGFAYG